MEFRATLNFRKFKVAPNSMYRIFDTMNVASIDKEWLYTSKSKSWKVLETVLSHLKGIEVLLTLRSRRHREISL